MESWETGKGNVKLLLSVRHPLLYRRIRYDLKDYAIVEADYCYSFFRL